MAIITINLKGGCFVSDSLRTSEYKKITAQQAKQLLSSLSCYAIVVDVRQPEEYYQGHIKGAVNIPINALKEKAPIMLPDINQEIIVYCRTGIRSLDAAHILENMGYKNVFDLGSINNWCYEIIKR